MTTTSVQPRTPLSSDRFARLDRAIVSLDGLSTGDAFGGRFFLPPGESRTLPVAPWSFSDDSVMASVIVARLEADGEIEPTALARDFADAYRADPYRGYGLSVRRVLEAIGNGTPWTEAAALVFGGAGSMGNGGAMRVAPLGAFFADDLKVVVQQAELSAKVTHTHPEGRAGAIAVAVAAALAARGATGAEMLATAYDHTPLGETRDGIVAAMQLGFAVSPVEAAELLGNGQRITAPDTVPFALWCAARFLGNYEESLWEAVSVGGDNDTLGAIVGGIAVLGAGPQSIPTHWLKSRESLGRTLQSREAAR